MTNNVIDLSQRIQEYIKHLNHHREQTISYEAKIIELQELIQLSIAQQSDQKNSAEEISPALLSEMQN